MVQYLYRKSAIMMRWPFRRTPTRWSRTKITKIHSTITNLSSPLLTKVKMSPRIKADIAHLLNTVALWDIENQNRWRIIKLKIKARRTTKPLQINIWTNKCLLISKQRKRLKDSSEESRIRPCRNLLLDLVMKLPPSIKLDRMWQISRRSLFGNFGMLGQTRLESWVPKVTRSKIQDCFPRVFHRREVMKAHHRLPKPSAHRRGPQFKS